MIMHLDLFADKIQAGAFDSDKLLNFPFIGKIFYIFSRCSLRSYSTGKPNTRTFIKIAIF